MPKSVESCVKKLREKKGIENEWAVCTAAYKKKAKKRRKKKK